MATTAIGVAGARRTGLWFALLVLIGAVGATLALTWALRLDSPEQVAPRRALPVTSPEAGRIYAPAVQAPAFSPEAGRTYAPAAQAPAFSPEAGRTYTPQGDLEIFSPERHRV